MKRLGFWAAVAVVSVIAPVGFNALADSAVGQKIPGLVTLNSYATRRAG